MVRETGSFSCRGTSQRTYFYARMSAQCANLPSKHPQLAQQITLILIGGCLHYRYFYCKQYTLTLEPPMDSSNMWNSDSDVRSRNILLLWLTKNLKNEGNVSSPNFQKSHWLLCLQKLFLPAQKYMIPLPLYEKTLGKRMIVKTLSAQMRKTKKWLFPNPFFQMDTNQPLLDIYLFFN